MYSTWPKRPKKPRRRPGAFLCIWLPEQDRFLVRQGLETLAQAFEKKGVSQSRNQVAVTILKHGIHQAVSHLCKESSA